MKISVVEDRGTHLLIQNGEQYAVIERRNGRFYGCHGGERASTAASDISAVGDILDSSDWVVKEAARNTFDSIVERGTELAQRMR
jgi:hypothetical protein